MITLNRNSTLELLYGEHSARDCSEHIKTNPVSPWFILLSVFAVIWIHFLSCGDFIWFKEIQVLT